MLSKVLLDGKACHGGTFNYEDYLGKWTPNVEPILCHSGYHLTTNPWAWYRKGAVVYQAEGRGGFKIGDDKIVFASVRLTHVNIVATGQFRRLENAKELLHRAVPNDDLSLVHIDDARKDTIQSYSLNLSTISQSLGGAVGSLITNYAEDWIYELYDKTYAATNYAFVHQLSRIVASITNDYVFYSTEDHAAYRFGYIRKALELLSRETEILVGVSGDASTILYV